MKRRYFFVIGLLGLAATLWFWRNPRGFHEKMPEKTATFKIIDDRGAGVPAPRIVVTTTYWYPSLLGRAKSLSFEDQYVGDDAGRVLVGIKRHHQVTKVRLSISAKECRTYETGIYDDSPWLEVDSPTRRIPLVRDDARYPSPSRTWGDENGSAEQMKVPWTGKPLWLSFATGKISEEPGDLSLKIERPSSDDPGKEDKPVRLSLHYPAGLMQTVARNEVAFELKRGPLSLWGEHAEIVSERKNSRYNPAFMEGFAFTSSDRRVRGAIWLTCDPISERKGEAATASILISGRVDNYPIADEPSKSPKPAP